MQTDAHQALMLYAAASGTAEERSELLAVQAVSSSKLILVSESFSAIFWRLISSFELVLSHFLYLSLTTFTQGPFLVF